MKRNKNNPEASLLIITIIFDFIWINLNISVKMYDITDKD